MEKPKTEPKNAKGKPTEEKETILTEAIGLLSAQAQRTLHQELLKAQDSPNPPFFLRKKSLVKNDRTDEDFEKDKVELQNFAFVIAESMAHLLKQAEQSLLEKLKKPQADPKKPGTAHDPKQREDEVQHFSKVFAETRTKLVEKVKELVKELRKGDGAEEDSPKRSDTILSTIGVDYPNKNPTKRSAPSTSYTSERDIAKKPRISPIKPSAAKKTKPSRDDVCYICEEKGHWAYQCTQPDNRRCYSCNKTGHISTECPLLKSTKSKSSRKRNRRSYSRERSSSRERSYSSETSERSYSR